MSYLCPVCKADDSLKCNCSIELPPAFFADEYSIAVVECLSCRFQGVTTCRESRWGSLDSESVSYFCHKVADTDLERLFGLIRGCPEPSNRRCQCRSHELLAKTDSMGAYDLALIVPVQQTFEMKS